MAERIQGLTIGLDMETMGINRSLSEIKRSFRGLNSSIKLNTNNLRYGEKSVENYESTISSLNDDIVKQRKNLDDLGQKYKEAAADGNENSAAAQRLAAEYNKQADNLNYLERQLENAKKEYAEFQRQQEIQSSGLYKTGTRLTNFGDKLQVISGKTKEVGKSLTKWITMPAVGVASAAAGITTAFGWDRLTGLDSAQAQLKGLGYNTEEVGKITDHVTNAIDGGMTTMAEGTQVAAGAMAAGVEEGEELERYIKLVGDAAVGANRPVGDMAQIFNRVQGQGKLMTQELNMIEQGMPGFSQAMAKHLNVSQEEFREMVTAGEVSSEEFLDVMEDFAGGMAEAYADSWQGMVANTKAYIGQIGEKLLGGVFEKSKESLSQFIDILSSDAAATWAEETGKKIGDMFSNLVDKVKGAITWFMGLNSSQKKLIGSLGAVVVAAGPLLVALGTLGGVIGRISSGLGTFGINAANAGGLLRYLRVGFMSLTGPVGIAVAAIAGLATGLVLAYQKSETFRNVVNKIKDAFLNAVSGIKEFLTTNPQVLAFVDGVKKAFQTMKTLVSQAIHAVVSFFKQKIAEMKAFWDENGQMILQAFKNVFTGIKAVVSPVLNFLITIFQKTFPILKTILSAAFKVMLEIVKSVWGNIKGTINGGLKIIQGLIQTFSGIFTGDFSKMWEGIKNLFKGAIEFIWNFVQLMFWGKLLKGVVGFAKGFSKPLTSMWTSIKDLFSRVISWIVEFVKNSFTKMRQTIGSISSGIQKVLDTVWNFILNIIKKVVQAIFNFVKNRFTAMHDTISTIFSATRKFISTVWNAILSFFKTIIKAIVDFVKSRFTNLRKSISTIFNAIKNFISTVWNAIYTFFKTIIKSIVDFVKNRFTSMKNNVSGIFSSISNITKKAWNAIKNYIINPVKKSVKWTMDKFNSFKTSVSKLFSKIKENVSGYVSDMVETIKGMPGRMKEGIRSGASKVMDGFLHVAHQMVRGIQKGVNGVIAGVNWAWEKLTSTKDKFKTWTIPFAWYRQSYAHGTKGHPDNSPALVGDGKGSNAGPELITRPNGEQYLSPSKPTVVPMEKGTHVTPAKKTKEMLANIPHYAWGTKAWDKVIDGIGNVKNSVVSKAKKAGSKIKDGTLWMGKKIKNGAKAILNKALEAVGIKTPKGDNKSARGLIKESFLKTKDAALEKIKEKLNELSFDGGGMNVFGSPFRKTSGYGMRWGKMHRGIDFAAPLGTAVKSATSGTVKQAGWGHSGSGYGNYGNVVSVMSGAYELLYTHLSKVLAKKGQGVTAGQKIGEVGSTGNSTGPHVHFEARKNGELGNTVDPSRFLKSAGKVSGNVKTWIKQAMARAGVSGKNWIDGLSFIIQKESSGNPKAVGAMTSTGTAKGLMQLKDFNISGNPFDPINNITAGIKYIKSRYGSIAKAVNWHKSHNWYASGGRIGSSGLYKLAEEGWPEYVIPTDPRRRTDAMKLLALAGKEIQGNKRPQQLPNVSGTSNDNDIADKLDRLIELMENMPRGDIHFHDKNNSPSENARKVKQVQRQWALGL